MTRSAKKADRASRLAILLGTVALAGCTMTPDHVRPDLPVAAAYPDHQGGGGARNASRPLQTSFQRDWRKFFTDPVLKDLIAVAHKALGGGWE